MSQGGVFLGLCRFCGGNIRSGIKFCGGCGKEIAAGVLVSASSGVTDPLAPLVTKVLPDLGKDSKKRRLVEARFSLVNPYGDWGKLICNDSQEKMWTPVSSREVDGRYAGNAFCCLYGKYSNTRFISKYTDSISDFAYQVHMGSLNGDLRASVIFRCEKLDGEIWVSSYYEFDIYSFDNGVSAHLNVSLAGKGRLLEGYNVSEFCPDISREGVLVGVVAVGGKIDLYVNLVHIGSVEDYSINSGNVGLSTVGNRKVAFSHAKVWSA